VDRDLRLTRLLEAVRRISGKTAGEQATIAELGIDSRHLVDLVFACEDIYGQDLDFGRIDLHPDMSLEDLHRQIIASLPSEHTGRRCERE